MSTRWSPSVLVTSVTVPPFNSVRPSWVVICFAPVSDEMSVIPASSSAPISNT